MTNKNMKKLIFSAAIVFVSSALVTPNTVNAASKTANVPIVSQKMQTFEVLRNVFSENYVLLINKETGEFFDAEPNNQNCDYWKNKKPGDVLRMKEMVRQASYGKFSELSATDGDACVGIYSSRNQGDYY